MTEWKQKLSAESIFFITVDIKRGLGLERVLPNYHIICSYNDPIIGYLRKEGANIFCLEEITGSKARKVTTTGRLLENIHVSDYIGKNAKKVPWVIYFKPSLKIEILCGKLGYRRIGNTRGINEIYENKVNFAKLAEKYFSDFFIPSITGKLSELQFSSLVRNLDLPFVVQFGHGWAGKTTYFIKKEAEFYNLKKSFYHTKVVASKLIKGHTALNNCCIYADNIFISEPASQINAVNSLSENPGVTCGRVWPSFLDNKQVEAVRIVSRKIGTIMKKSGFKGFFGIDFLIEEETGKVFASEINSRLTASSSFYTYLELGKNVTPLLSYHLDAFLNKGILSETGGKVNISGSQLNVYKKAHNLAKIHKEDFGVYKITDSQPEIVRKEYKLESLNDKEYIFINKIKISKSTDEEIGRLETKSRLLKDPYNLAPWLEKMLTLS